MARARVVFLSIVLFAALAGAFVWLARTGNFGPIVQEVTLTNGVTLRLVSVQCGTRHRNPFDTPWQQLASLVPDAVARRLKLPPANPILRSGTNKVLTAWITVSPSVPSPSPGQPAFGLLMGDDEGNFAGDAGFMTLNGKTGDGRFYEGHRFAIFPRRSPTLRLRVYADPWNQGNLLHEFRIPNRFRSKAPPWTHPPAPATAANGDLQAMLESFLIVTNASSVNGYRDRSRSVHLEFSVRQGGAPTTNWVAYHVQRVADATGNEGDGNSWNHGWEGERTYNRFSQWPLPAGEPWQMQVEFCQTAGFPESEIWHVGKVPIQDDAAPAPEVRTHMLHGERITLVRLGTPQWGRNRSDSPKRDVVLQLKAGGKPDLRRWHLTVVRAVASTGEAFASGTWSGSDDDREFTFNVSTNAGSMDFWIAYAPSRILEFTAEPTLSGSNR